jgi:hypothetical protein
MIVNNPLAAEAVGAAASSFLKELWIFAGTLTKGGKSDGIRSVDNRQE